MAEQLAAEARGRIDARVIEKRNEGIEKAIVAHYTELARGIMLPIWKECRKRTGHTCIKSTDSYGRSEGPRQCATCHVPMTDDRKESRKGTRAESGFHALGKTLRQADVDAKIEWIP